MEPKVKPAFQTREYHSRDVIAIRDRWQQFLYVKNNAYPLDMYVDSKDNLVMIFDKSETRELYEKYRRYELK